MKLPKECCEGCKHTSKDTQHLVKNTEVAHWIYEAIVFKAKCNELWELAALGSRNALRAIPIEEHDRMAELAWAMRSRGLVAFCYCGEGFKQDEWDSLARNENGERVCYCGQRLETKDGEAISRAAILGMADVFERASQPDSIWRRPPPPRPNGGERAVLAARWNTAREQHDEALRVYWDAVAEHDRAIKAVLATGVASATDALSNAAVLAAKAKMRAAHDALRPEELKAASAQWAAAVEAASAWLPAVATDRCSHVAFGSTGRFQCRLAAGHDGAHDNELGQQWDATAPQLPTDPTSPRPRGRMRAQQLALPGAAR